MNNICLLPVMHQSAGANTRHTSPKHPLLRFDADRCRNEPQNLLLDGEQRLVVTPTNADSDHVSGTLLATLTSRNNPGSDKTVWWLIPRSRLLIVNGIRPMPLVALERGDLLAHGTHHWMVASLWVPVPITAPKSVAKRECPVCGAQLDMAPVLQCSCGRYYHLEDPDDPENPKKLNCYLASPCGLCRREPALEPRLVPEPDEKLDAMAVTL